MELKKGTLLQDGKYKIIDVLGQGGFGITYLAEEKVKLAGNLNDRYVTQKVAIKEFFMKEKCNRDTESSCVSISASGSVDLVENFKKKFYKEAKNISGLRHDHIVEVYEVFEENGTVYYVMEHIPAGSLEDHVVLSQKLVEAEALRYIAQIADALKYIHNQRINHLDVKPSNILIKKGDLSVLIDFGLAKQYDDSGSQTSATPVGTSRGYAPLEQYKAGGMAMFSPATDIYSLGATLYKLVTGCTPPEAQDVFDSGLPELPDSVSERVRMAIAMAMKPSRTERLQSVDEFLKILCIDDVDDDLTKLVVDEGAESVQRVETQDEQIVVDEDATKNEVSKKVFESTLRSAEKGNVAAQFHLAICYQDGDGVEQDSAEAVKWCRKAAEQGCAEAQYNLGCFYETGDGVEQDWVEAVKWYRKAAEQGNSNALWNLSVCYRMGNGVAQDLAEANRLLCIGAKQDHAESQWGLGVSYYYGKNGFAKNYRKARKWLDKSAKQGNDKAQFYLAECAYYGHGALWKNQSYAIELYKKSAKQGNPSAQRRLGYLYYFGCDGVKQSYEEAFRWYMKAANAGSDLSQRRVGDCYYDGKGVERDKGEAVKWYRKAAEQGDIDTQKKLANCYYEGDGVEQDYAEAIEWYRKAAEQGDAESQNRLGKCYLKGEGVEKDYAEAVKWFFEAKDYAESCFKLAGCFAFGYGVDKSEVDGRRYLLMSAEKGYTEAQLFVGIMYLYGEDGVEKDLYEAEKWLEKAAKSDNVEAMYLLGKCNQELGWGSLAKDWFLKAAKQGYADAQNALGDYEVRHLKNNDYHKAIAWWRNAAAQGQLDAKCSLGDCYLYGNGVEIDRGKALELLEEAVEQGSKRAKKMLEDAGLA